MFAGGSAGAGVAVTSVGADVTAGSAGAEIVVASAGAEIAGGVELEVPDAPDGLLAGGLVAGGLLAGWLLAGGLVAGGLLAGELVAGGLVAGELVAGGLVAGELVAGGLVAGGAVAGGAEELGLVRPVFDVGREAELEPDGALGLKAFGGAASPDSWDAGGTAAGEVRTGSGFGGGGGAISSMFGAFAMALASAVTADALGNVFVPARAPSGPEIDE